MKPRWHWKVYAAEPLGNFYALGQDAWRLLPWLPLMQKDPDLWFPGDVGALRLQANGRHLQTARLGTILCRPANTLSMARQSLSKQPIFYHTAVRCRVGENR